jgi:hypothetical protein
MLGTLLLLGVALLCNTCICITPLMALAEFGGSSW